MKKIRRIVRDLDADAERVQQREARRLACEARGVLPRKPYPEEVTKMESWEEALKQAEDLIELIDEDVSENAKAKAGDFFESIRDRTSGIIETITRTKRVTDGQRSALNGWEAGVRKWLK